MPVNPFGHIDLRVTELEAAKAFYQDWLGALGFTSVYEGNRWMVFRTSEEFPSAPFFAITEESEHKPNANRVAFWVPSTERVDELARLVTSSGARNVEGPAPCKEYSPSYYAVFFEDFCGNRLEVYFRSN